MATENDVLDDSISSREVTAPSDYKFPLELKFKIGTLSNDFTAKDADGESLAYVRQKMFKLKDHVQVFTNESKKDIAYEIKADKIAGLKVCYAFTDSEGNYIGKVARKGMKSLWNANYLIYDNNEKSEENEFNIREENPWAKVMDSLLGEIPILGFFTGYLFNPKYIVKRTDGSEIARLKKEPSFFGRKFSLHKLNDVEKGEDERILLGLVMMSLNERRRG